MSKGPDEPARWQPGLIAAALAPRCGARRRRVELLCQAPAMLNGRCRVHGGASTGPRTPDGLARCVAAATKHGGRNAAARARAAQRGQARARVAELRRILAVTKERE